MIDPTPSLPLPKVLVVDDLSANRVALRRLLSQLAGVVVVEAASGDEALQVCLDQEFALILLDVQMPGMDGFEVAAVLSGDPGTRETPIIFVTAAFSDDLNRLRGYEFGAVDYIAKPINDRILLSKVRVFLDLWSSKQQLRLLLETLNDRNLKLEQEITERKRTEALVRHQAQHDELTGLPNRILFLDRADSALARAMRHRQSCALLYLDLDGFKPVNDNHGHPAGDAILKLIALRLQAAVRKTDTVARVGGDEFAIVLDEVASPQAALQVGQKLCELLVEPLRLQLPEGEVMVRIGASIGVAVYPEHGSSREELLTAADAAMYRAKRAGKNHALLSDQHAGAASETD